MLAAHDPEAVARSPAIAQDIDHIRRGTAKSVTEALKYFGEQPLYDRRLLTVFAHALEETLPILVGRMTPSARNDTVRQLESITRAEHDPELAGALHALLRATERGRST